MKDKHTRAPRGYALARSTFFGMRYALERLRRINKNFPIAMLVVLLEHELNTLEAAELSTTRQPDAPKNCPKKRSARALPTRQT
jgi:hypothetical protein